MPMVKKSGDMFSLFGTIPECDRQKDRRTDTRRDILPSIAQ